MTDQEGASEEGAMIVCGSPSRFAVKWQASYPGDQPIGRFALVVLGEEVGDFSDDGTYLIGCYNWTADLLHGGHDRFEPGLFEMDRDEVFKRLVHPVFGHYYGVECPPEPYADIYGRFHVQHIGMTSMEKVVLLFVQNQRGESRFIWQVDYGATREARFDVGEVEDVFAEFLVKALPDMPSGNKVASLPDRADTLELPLADLNRDTRRPGGANQAHTGPRDARMSPTFGLERHKVALGFTNDPLGPAPALCNATQ